MRKRASLAQFTACSKPTAHRFHNCPRQRQSQAGAVDSRFTYRRAAVKRLKDVFDLVFANADPLVFNRQFHFLNAASAFHRDC